MSISRHFCFWAKYIFKVYLFGFCYCFIILIITSYSVTVTGVIESLLPFSSIFMVASSEVFLSSISEIICMNFSTNATSTHCQIGFSGVDFAS